MFQIHQIPIRDWNIWLTVNGDNPEDSFKFTKSLLGIETLRIAEILNQAVGFQIHQIPIRDWNQISPIDQKEEIIMFQIHQIPIRDWNIPPFVVPTLFSFWEFQIHQIPIRDWNHPFPVAITGL